MIPSNYKPARFISATPVEESTGHIGLTFHCWGTSVDLRIAPPDVKALQEVLRQADEPFGSGGSHDSA
tara:strand:- start:14688 stop:14891 length:204 start_codon:yes stop_codon:yes gene_type:complete